MAGHSKFKNIMHRKGAQDAKRAREFAKLTREIMVAAREGGDPDKNTRLRLAIQAARAGNMPKDNIERAIKKVTEGADNAIYEEVRYEGYGPGNVALIVEGLTDNRNRTASEVRAAFSKNGGSMGETNSVAFNFERVGLIRYPLDVADHETVFEAAAEAGADNVVSDDPGTEDGMHEITCQPDDLNAVREALEQTFGEASAARLDWQPLNTVPVDEDAAQTLFKLIDVLEDSDDVQRVSANFEISDEIMERLSA